MDNQTAEVKSNTEVDITKLDLKATRQIIIEHDKLLTALNRYCGDLSFFKFSDVPCLLRHAEIAKYIKTINELISRAQFYNAQLNKYCAVTKFNEDGTELEYEAPDPFGWPTVHVCDVYKLVDDSALLLEEITDLFLMREPPQKPHLFNIPIEGPWEVFDQDAFVKNVHALYILQLRAEQVTLIEPAMTQCIALLARSCALLSFESVSIKGDGNTVIIPTWISSKEVTLTRTSEKVYMTQEERAAKEQAEREAAQRKAEAERLEQLKGSVSEFVSNIDAAIEEFEKQQKSMTGAMNPNTSLAQRFFKNGLFKQLENPTEDIVEEIGVIQTFIGDFFEEKMKTSAPIHPPSKEEICLFIDSVRKTPRVAVRQKWMTDKVLAAIIRFFYKAGFEVYTVESSERFDDTVQASDLRGHMEETFLAQKF